MGLADYIDRMRNFFPPEFPPEASSSAFARSLDQQDQLRHLRDEFLLPTKASLKKRALNGTLPGIPLIMAQSLSKCALSGVPADFVPFSRNRQAQTSSSDAGAATRLDDTNDKPEQQAIYFVGNSLGAQPRAVRQYVDAQLETWASIGVHGHFTDMGNSPLTQWQDLADACAHTTAAIVGCAPHEVVIMNTLTVNLHLMMASFYLPSGRRHKIILEWKPFPSDHYAIESHIRWHGLDPAISMIKIEPEPDSVLIPTEKILRTIDDHADETALLLLPGIQYYSGQLFDMNTITAYARARGIIVGWDLAHAIGNVELQLHDWDVDFACWCTYKYLNAGPGAIGGAFVHERHGTITASGDGGSCYKPRLSGWYGGDKSVRFNMDNRFVPTPGAAGFQLSNPSVIDLASLAGALSVFSKTSMRDLRSKALVLTAYTEHLLRQLMASEEHQTGQPLIRIITPADPAQRGTQLSLLLREGLLDGVARALEKNGVAIDQRKPDVIRIAPAPLYCSFEDVSKFIKVLRDALALSIGTQPLACTPEPTLYSTQKCLWNI